MYKLNISTTACMQASLPISEEVANYLSKRLMGVLSIRREDLLQRVGYPVGVGSNSGSFLDSVYNFANAILTESNAEEFKVQIEAIPSHQKVDSIFKGSDSIPEEGRSVVVFFVDKKIEAKVRYCDGCKAWHAADGDLKVDRIHQWAYTEDFYKLLDIPEFPETKSKNMDDISDAFARVFLLKALMEAAKSQSEKHPRSFF